MTTESRQLAHEIGVDAADRFSMRMVECGLHSGFPPCCITFFVKVWWPWTVALDRLSARSRAEALVAYDAYQKWSTRPGYVPCPQCVLERSFVEVKDCDCELTRAARSRR